MARHFAPHRLSRLRLSRKQQKQLIRHSVLAVAIIEPVMTLPQIYEIWIKHQAAGVSGITWGLYVVAAFVWLMYGLQLKDKPLIISSSLWIIMETAVVVGTLIYS